MTRRLLLIVIAGFLTSNLIYADGQDAPFGSSKFVTFDGVNELEQLKVVVDFNFADPAGIARALYPVSLTLTTVQEVGPVSFEPIDMIVVSHGSEVVAFAKQNYERYKDIVDRAARLADLGVKFEICNIAAGELGFESDDFHGFVSVVPNGGFALIYHQNRGYALMPGAATVPGNLINANNRPFLGKNSD